MFKHNTLYYYYYLVVKNGYFIVRVGNMDWKKPTNITTFQFYNIYY